MFFVTDVLTKEQRSKNMRSIRSKDTMIEVILRKALWDSGFRYRKNYTKLPGKPDIAITKYKIAVFCDSEFFHGKDWDDLKIRLLKGDNGAFWVDKIEKNREHEEINKKLSFLGWKVIRFWGNDIKKNTGECVKVICEAVFDQRIVKEL